MKIERSIRHEVLALTDVGAAYAVPDGAGYQVVHKTLAAFKRVADGAVQEGLFELAARVPDERVQLYLNALPADRIVRVQVTRAQGILIMHTLPEPAEDAELAALCQAQTAEQVFDVAGLGRFVLDRMNCVYRAAYDWMGQTVALEIEQPEDTDALAALLRVVSDAAQWEERLQQIAREQTGQAGVLDSVLADAAGELTFWMTAGEQILSVSAESDGTIGAVQTLSI